MSYSTLGCKCGRQVLIRNCWCFHLNRFKRVPILGPAAVYEDVCAYMLVLADLRLTFAPMVGMALHDTLANGVAPSVAIEKCVWALRCEPTRRRLLGI